MFASVDGALGYFICCRISFMFSFIWDIRLSMLIAGLAGADFLCADTIGADGAQSTIAESSIGVFILVFPLGLNKFIFPLRAGTGSRGLP
jgi:hypothetical protein